ncbi:hypothetical protein MMPV_002279 [Pyropia vietnamensis]
MGGDRPTAELETLLVIPRSTLADASGAVVATGPCTFAQTPVGSPTAAAPTASGDNDEAGYLAVACIGNMMLPLVPSCTTVLPYAPTAFILALGEAATGAVTSYTLTVGADTPSSVVKEVMAILKHFTTMETAAGGDGSSSSSPSSSPPPPMGAAAAGRPPSNSPGLAGRVERGSEAAARKILTLGEAARSSIHRRLATATANARGQAGANQDRADGGTGRGRRDVPVPKAMVWTFSGVGRASSGVASALSGVGERVARTVGGGLAESGVMRRAREAPPNSVGGVFHTALSTGCLAFANIYEAADETGRAILTTTATGATALTDARYGPRAASVAHDTGLTAVSAYRVMRFPSKFGATTIIKTFATTTADGARVARDGSGGVGSGVAAAAATGSADWDVGGMPGAPGGAVPVGGSGGGAASAAAGRGEALAGGGGGGSEAV